LVGVPEKSVRSERHAKKDTNEGLRRMKEGHGVLKEVPGIDDGTCNIVRQGSLFISRGRGRENGQKASLYLKKDGGRPGVAKNGG